MAWRALATGAVFRLRAVGWAERRTRIGLLVSACAPRGSRAACPRPSKCAAHWRDLRIGPFPTATQGNAAKAATASRSAYAVATTYAVVTAWANKGALVWLCPWVPHVKRGHATLLAIAHEWRLERLAAVRGAPSSRVLRVHAAHEYPIRLEISSKSAAASDEKSVLVGCAISMAS